MSFAVLTKGEIYEFETMAQAEAFAASLPIGQRYYIGERP